MPLCESNIPQEWQRQIDEATVFQSKFSNLEDHIIGCCGKYFKLKLLIKVVRFHMHQILMRPLMSFAQDCRKQDKYTAIYLEYSSLTNRHSDV